MKYRIYRALLVTLISILQGCTRNIMMEKIPEIKTKSPLSEVKPLNIVIREFGYESLSKTAEFIKVQKDGLNKEIKDIVLEAISNELRRNGHNVFTSVNADTNADMIIEGNVSKYEHLVIPGWTAKINTIIEVKLLYINRGSDKPILKTYSGNYTHARPTWETASKMLEKCTELTLLNMVEKFTTDPELMDIFKELEKHK